MATRASKAPKDPNDPKNSQNFTGRVRKWEKRWVPVGAGSAAADRNGQPNRQGFSVLRWVPTGTVLHAPLLCATQLPVASGQQAELRVPVSPHMPTL